MEAHVSRLGTSYLVINNWMFLLISNQNITGIKVGIHSSDSGFQRALQ